MYIVLLYQKQTMKTIKVTYWATTAIVALMMTYSAYAYLTADAMKQAFHHLAFSDTFRVELAIAKFIGVVLLLAPVGSKVKEWTYAGFTFTFIAAVIAHATSGDPMSAVIAPFIILMLLSASYFTYHKLQNALSAQRAR
jgi:hypothetical protein